MAVEAYEGSSSPKSFSETAVRSSLEQRGVLPSFPKKGTIMEKPPVFQFHDGTPEGENAYFEAVGRAYFADWDTDCNEFIVAECEGDEVDVPLLHEALQTEAWHQYWQQLGAYYEAKFQALGFVPRDEQPNEDMVFEDIDRSLSSAESTQQHSPISVLFSSAFAADE